MKTINEKLAILKTDSETQGFRIMIIGLGSVGNYLLNYLLSECDETMHIIVVGRNESKMSTDVNIARVSSMIRNQYRSRVTVAGDVDLDDVASIVHVIETYNPDIIVNSSRAYSGLKYGSISWTNVRAYGLWTPLASRFTSNIMAAYEQAGSDAIVINTSYSDAVIPWLKSAGRAYPDYGSGNINHLIPRIRFAVADELDIDDSWNIDVTFAVAHFHDVVISKEGHTEGIDMLIDIRYKGEHLNLDINRIISKCNIPMPTDQKRNQMNASSNFEIIMAIRDAVRKHACTKIHSPGVFGEIGGYPVIVDGTGELPCSYIYEGTFNIEQMRDKNRESIYLDGIEDVRDGVLYYTDELIHKVKKAFDVDLFKSVSFDEINPASDFLISRIIEPFKA